MREYLWEINSLVIQMKNQNLIGYFDKNQKVHQKQFEEYPRKSTIHPVITVSEGGKQGEKNP